MSSEVDDEFHAALFALGFRATGNGRHGTLAWQWQVNRHLTVAVHDRGGSHVVISWALSLGEYVEERGWRLSVTDTSTAELYPQRDVQVSRDIESVGAEINRVVSQLRFDLGAGGW